MKREDKPHKMPSPRAGLADEVAGLVSGLPGVRQGSMFGCPAFFVGKKLFACVYGEGLALKLPAGDADGLVGRKDCERFAPMGRKMRDWIQITSPDLADYRSAKGLILRSAGYVASLS